MLEFSNHWLYEFVTLIVILDPVATIPVFIAATVGLKEKQARMVAVYAVGTSFFVLLFFIACGQILLEAMKIPMASFQLAGGLLLLFLGFQMTTGHLHTSAATQHDNNQLWARAIYPLAMPGIAGGGSILAVVLLTDNKTRNMEEQWITVGVLLTCMLVHLLSYFSASLVVRLLGLPGISIISRVFGLVLISIAVNTLIVAIKISFGLES